VRASVFRARPCTSARRRARYVTFVKAATGELQRQRLDAPEAPDDASATAQDAVRRAAALVGSLSDTGERLPAPRPCVTVVAAQSSTSASTPTATRPP